MALNIKSELADELARTLAKRTGESITHAVIRAIEERLATLDAQDAERIERERALIAELVEEIKRMPVLDPRSPDELIGYDEMGL